MSGIHIYPAGTTTDGRIYRFPWRSDAICYNFRVPEIMVPDDRIEEMITDPLDVETLVVTSDLENYDFISGMKNLKQLYLYKAYHLEHLFMIKDLVKLRQVMVAHGRISCMDSVDSFLVNKKKALDASPDDPEARITYGVEGFYIHADDPELRIDSWDMGVHVGEFTVYLAKNDPENESDLQNIEDTSPHIISVTDDTLKGGANMRAITIKTNGEYEVTELENGRKSIKEIIGGDIEGLTYAGHTDFIMFLNETGKIFGLETNALAAIFSLEFTESIPFIYGDVVICGLDDEGASCDLTDEQVEKFMKILDGID